MTDKYAGGILLPDGGGLSEEENAINDKHRELKSLTNTVAETLENLAGAVRSSLGGSLEGQDQNHVALYKGLRAPVPDPEPVIPDPDPEPDPDPDIPPVVTTSIQDALKAIRAEDNGITNPVILNLGVGDYAAFGLGDKDEDKYVDVRFLGGRTLKIVGPPSLTAGGAAVILPMHNLAGWGDTIGIKGAPAWEGRVHFENLHIHCTARNAIMTQTSFDPDNLEPYKDVRVIGCAFLDHPLGIRCKRPVSVNQCAFSAEKCHVNLPLSDEHWIYSRNPCGDSLIHGNIVMAVGAQVLQFVGRDTEGPFYGRSKVIVSSNHWEGYHRAPGRAASAISIAGSCQDWEIKNNVIMDDNPSGVFGELFGVLHTGGGMVVWSGDDPTSNYSSYTLPGGYQNGIITAVNNVFYQKNGKRSVVSLERAEQALFEGNQILGQNSKVEDVPDLFWDNNNNPELAFLALDVGVPSSELETYLELEPYGDIRQTWSAQ